MRTFSILAATAAITLPVMADFYIYSVQESITVDGSVLNGYSFFAGPPSCADVGSDWYPSASDLSGKNASGVRCKGCSLAIEGGDSVAVTELEFKTKWGHYTYYEDRDGALVDIDDVVVGNCHTDASDTFDCFYGTGSSIGGSQLFCSTSLAIP
ncbi:hypothetical protein G6011_02932 [Alternaria panax]|uniref:Uncharacterized protein n=1 Tax=Alternaria panax TaxID=48097 RepID=A0AAD4FBW5_9PLEO|nr:hypothetical protein G6011_02932 [Alternaria panax]